MDREQNRSFCYGHRGRNIENEKEERRIFLEESNRSTQLHTTKNGNDVDKY